MLRNDTSARMAALTAAKVAAPQQRVSMVAFLDVCRSVVVRLGAADEDVRLLFNALARDIQAKDWNSADIVEAERQLAMQDQEYTSSTRSSRFEGIRAEVS